MCMKVILAELKLIIIFYYYVSLLYLLIKNMNFNIYKNIIDL